MKIEPLFNYVILKRRVLESSLIIIPDDAAKRHADTTGIVEAAGPACEDYVQKLVGMEVIFKPQAGVWAKPPEGDEEYYALEETDIIGAIK
jgi:co-chaperonin GroES (HSP10)